MIICILNLLCIFPYPKSPWFFVKSLEDFCKKKSDFLRFEVFQYSDYLKTFFPIKIKIVIKIRNVYYWVFVFLYPHLFVVMSNASLKIGYLPINSIFPAVYSLAKDIISISGIIIISTFANCSKMLLLVRMYSRKSHEPSNNQRWYFHNENVNFQNPSFKIFFLNNLFLQPHVYILYNDTVHL